MATCKMTITVYCDGQTRIAAYREAIRRTAVLCLQSFEGGEVPEAFTQEEPGKFWTYTAATTMAVRLAD